MGLNIRPTSGRIANGSRLVVSGENTQGAKVFPNSFNQKSNPYSANDFREGVIITPTPSVTPIIPITPSVTPSNTPTPPVTPNPTPTPSFTPNPTSTVTPQPTVTPSPVVNVLIDPILTRNDEYIKVGDNQYLMFVDTEV